ncbi:major facilitator superfamily domain-containing protein [Aspergillus cavernicola]|uniref:Major facilitator superfamily domain-containing protein n=1 Tax=Aspergillus cavernicola TaxID=176166 RepID=A0ABR4IZ57_9EURO
MAIMLTLFLSTLLAVLEIGIIATAVPGITNDFHQLDDVGWYGSATFLLVYLGSVVFYLVDSIVAAAAPNSLSVIVGRAIQGLGAAGTLGGSVLVISVMAEPQKRPVLIGSWMGVFMVSTILGPVLGGVFTTEVSWRWCFWINLPLGGPIVILWLVFLRVPKHIKPAPATWNEILLRRDLPGFSLLLASLVCFALALQWGGQTKAWSARVVIATLVLWIAFTILFFLVEALQGSRAMVPLRLLKPRMTWANALWCYISNSFYQVMFYLPIYFQSIHGKSAIMSGVDTLPFLAFFSLGALISGALVGKTHHLMPYQLLSALITVAGMALFYTTGVNSPQARYLGPQVLYGFGLGLGNQNPMTAVQAFSQPDDVASSTGIMLMCQSISGTYFVIIAQSLFANRMLHMLESSTNSNIDLAKALRTGTSEIRTVFRGEELAALTNAYMAGIRDVFAFGLAGAVAAVFLALLVPFKRLPDHERKKVETEETVQVGA